MNEKDWISNLFVIVVLLILLSPIGAYASGSTQQLNHSVKTLIQIDDELQNHTYQSVFKVKEKYRIGIRKAKIINGSLQSFTIVYATPFENELLEKEMEGVINPRDISTILKAVGKYVNDYSYTVAFPPSQSNINLGRRKYVAVIVSLST